MPLMEDVGWGILQTPAEVRLAVANRAKDRRLALNITQKALAEGTGVSISTIRKFERTGEVSLKSLLHIAQGLGVLEGFLSLFPRPETRSLQELLEDDRKPKRQRARGRQR